MTTVRKRGFVTFKNTIIIQVSVFSGRSLEKVECLTISAQQ